MGGSGCSQQFGLGPGTTSGLLHMSFRGDYVRGPQYRAVPTPTELPPSKKKIIFRRPYKII